MALHGSGEKIKSAFGKILVSVLSGSNLDMNDFDLSIQEGKVLAGNTDIPVLIVAEQRDLWIRGNNLTAFLEYAQPRVALTKILKTRNTKTFAELLPQVVSNMETTPVDDLRARYVNEPGLYRLIARSTMEKAEIFQDWVYEVVLPSIRKTGSYSVQAAAPAAKQSDTWHDKRLEGKELMRLKNASLQQLVAGGFGQTGPKLYRIVANHINQAVLGFTDTTTQFKKQQQLPRHVSIPTCRARWPGVMQRRAFKNLSVMTCSV